MVKPQVMDKLEYQADEETFKEGMQLGDLVGESGNPQRSDLNILKPSFS